MQARIAISTDELARRLARTPDFWRLVERVRRDAERPRLVWDDEPVTRRR